MFNKTENLFTTIEISILKSTYDRLCKIIDFGRLFTLLRANLFAVIVSIKKEYCNPIQY